MDFLRAILCVVVVVVLALLMGRTQNAKHPAVHFYVWSISITVLLILRCCL